MKKITSKMLMLCVSIIAAVGLGWGHDAQLALASDVIDENHIGLVVEKQDQDTLKLSLSHVEDMIKSIQFSIQIEGDVVFNEDSLNWLLQSSNNESIKSDVRFDEAKQVAEFIIVTTDTLHKKDAGVIEIAEIDIKPLRQEALQYSIKSVTNTDGTAFKYVVSATNKQVTGPAFNLINNGLLTYNNAPTLALIASSQVSNGKIYLTEGDEFTLEQQITFVQAMDVEDGEITEISVSGTVDTSIVGSYLLTYSVADSVGDTTSLDVPVIVEAKLEGEIPNPMISGVQTEVTLKIGDYFDPLTGVLATDYLGRELMIELSGDFEETLMDHIVTKEGVFTIFYNAEDRYGNVAASQQTTLIVEDTQEPGGEDNNTGGEDNNTGGGNNNTGGGNNNTGGEDNNAGGGNNNAGGESNTIKSEKPNTGYTNLSIFISVGMILLIAGLLTLKQVRNKSK